MQRVKGFNSAARYCPFDHTCVNMEGDVAGRPGGPKDHEVATQREVSMSRRIIHNHIFSIFTKCKSVIVKLARHLALFNDLLDLIQTSF